MTYLVDSDFIKMGIDPQLVNPTSFDLTISTYRRLKTPWRKRLGKPNKAKKLHDDLTYILGYRPDIFNKNHRDIYWDKEVKLESGDEIELLGYETVLFGSLRAIKIPENCLGILLSTSTFGRALQEHLHAGLFDAGFNGKGTFEVKNMAPFPVRLKFNQRIVQMVMFRGPTPKRAYDGRYQGQRGAEPAR